MKNKNLIGNTEEGFKAEVFAVQKEETIDKKNLMVGDWVKDLIDNNIVWQWEPCDYEEIEVDVLPIPITTEILEANGFIIRRDAYYLSCGFLGNDWSRSGVEVKFYDRAVIDIECNYFKHTNRVHLIAEHVHELQHALRLCGLNEIADNFKVE